MSESRTVKFRVPRGTHDILPEEQPYWRYAESVVHRLCQLYGYRRIDTPTFEETALFVRGVGEGTDIVDKEMYSFEDRGENSLTLRPEGTAPVVRAFIEHNMHLWPRPVKLYYLTSIFRYDRPQAGRYREHHQFGAEAIGEIDPEVDAEIISLAWDFYQNVGIKGISMQLNNIGCPRCRPAYLRILVAYYSEHRGSICPDCVRRLERNPLRLLDCKASDCQALIEGAPKSEGYLCPECDEHFAELRRCLELLGFPYELNHRLVRGLDYYTKTVFEFWAEGIGAQNAVGAGGRYDGLVEELGGKPAPGIGFGLGLERVILNMREQGIKVPEIPSPQVFVAYLGSEAKEMALILLSKLRAAGLLTVCSFGNRSLKAQMRQANALKASFVLILGDEELERGLVTCRDMVRGQQWEVELDNVVEYLAGYLDKNGGDENV